MSYCCNLVSDTVQVELKSFIDKIKRLHVSYKETLPLKVIFYMQF